MMSQKRITIRDVAKLAGVSVSTVSQILNGNSRYVGEAKRERVLQAAQELRYRPNAIARSMVKRRTVTVGMVFTSIVDNLFVQAVESVQEILYPEGYTILLASTHDVESEIQAIEALKAQQVDGFIFLSASSLYESAHLLLLQEEGIPFVTINRPLQKDCDFNQIHLNDREAGYLATKHLLSLNHTCIATISGPFQGTVRWKSAIERQLGWRQALEEHGMVVSPEWTFNGDYTYQGGYDAALQLLEQCKTKEDRPTALFIANDTMALGALRAFYHAGVRVPQDMALVTIGDRSYAAYTTPALTTLAHPLTEAGHLAARLLLEQFAATTSLPPQNIMLSFDLRVRESCGFHGEPKIVRF